MLTIPIITPPINHQPQIIAYPTLFGHIYIDMVRPDKNLIVQTIEYLTGAQLQGIGTSLVELPLLMQNLSNNVEERMAKIEGLVSSQGALIKEVRNKIATTVLTTRKVEVALPPPVMYNQRRVQVEASQAMVIQNTQSAFLVYTPPPPVLQRARP